MTVTRTCGMREVYEQFGASHRRIPVQMGFTTIERPWLREVVKEVTGCGWRARGSGRRRHTHADARRALRALGWAAA